MFWRFGGYANISTIDTLLDKQDVTLEELLDESDLIQELRSHNTKLIEYLREDPVLERLLRYVVAPKLEAVESASNAEKRKSADSKRTSSPAVTGSDEEEDEHEKKRNRYAYVSAEILSSDSWSLSAALLENQGLLKTFWDFLRSPPPLDPLQASYFTKVNEALLDKKTEEMLELFKSLDGVVKNMLQHVDSPMVMDLLLKIISLEKVEGGQGIVDWLHSQDLMPILLSFLSPEHSWATQTSAGDFLKAIITISANASHTEQSCIGPNELTRQLVSQPCVEKLISDMLKGGNPLTVGVGIVIEVIRKNNSDYDPDVGAEANSVPSSRDPIYLGNLLRMFAKHVPDFMALILSPNHTIGGGDGPVTIKRKELHAAFGGRIEPLGFDRFKTCELMAELLHCSNMGLLNEIGSEEFVSARDAERERLKVDGQFGESYSSRRNSLNDELTMKSSTASGRTGAQSPDTLRRLEVQNASEDDGFEEVTHSGDLEDDGKDEFDEKNDIEEDLLPASKDDSLSLVNDDDFVDEPLSSPRLNPDQEHASSLPDRDPAMTVLPLSPRKEPSKELSKEIKHLSIDEGQGTNTDAGSDQPPSFTLSGQQPSEASGHEINRPAEIAEEHAEDSASGLGSNSVSEGREAGLSPHLDDKPAPLFAQKPGSPTSAPNTHDDVDMIDAPMTEANETSTSIVLNNANDQSDTADMTSTNPVVGDYLKMQFVEHKVVPTIIDFFFRFPWNNFLHNVVYDVVQQVFNGPMDRGYNRVLAIDLFDTGNITMRIVDGQKKSDETQAKERMRLGYMGHLTLIAEEVVKFTERHPPELRSESVLEKVMDLEWIQYVEVTLAETRERDNAILGGVRPDVSVGPRQAVMNAVNAASGSFGGGSSALAEAGLNGPTGLDSMDLANGAGAAASGFALTGGSLLSGFGSSSDEDDEEMDEDNEDESIRNQTGDNDFTRYNSMPVAASTATSSESDPPSALPPAPPPLNTPSAARRRLAARLALHNKPSNESANGDDGDDNRAHRKDLNPFATEEDEEDVHDDFTIGDLEIEAEGKGILPPGTDLTGQHTPVEEIQVEPLGEDRINDHSSDERSSSDDSEDEFDSARGNKSMMDRNGKGRRPSLTTEARRRTSLEDDDEEEGVVHVASPSPGDEDDLVEIRHTETQSLESQRRT